MPIQKNSSAAEELKNNLFRPVLPAWLILILLSVWAWQVIEHYFTRFFINLKYLVIAILEVILSVKFSSPTFYLWGQYLISLLFLGWLLFLAFGLGRRILSSFKVVFISPLEEICFAMGVGWGGLAYLSFIFGVLGLLKREYFLALFLVISILGLFELKDFLKARKIRDRSYLAAEKIGWTGLIFLVILGLGIGMNFISAFCPEIFYDSLVYHLGAPNLFIQTGRITAIPFEVHSNLPSNMAMLYTICLLLKDEILAKLVHFAFGILVVLGIISFARRFFNSKIGLVAAAIFYTVPMVGMNSWSAAVDIGLTFFVFGAFYALVIWIMSLSGPNQTETANGWFILSAVLGGLALGTKYTAVFGLIMLGVLIAVYYKKKGDISPKVKQIAVFLGLVLLIFLPWLLKNLYFTGDPVYPYLASLTPENAHLKKFITVTREYFPSFKAYLVHPWTLTMGGDSNASFIGPIFLFFAPLLLFFKNKDRVTKILLIYLAGFWFIWSLASHMLRFFIPALPVFSILIAVYVWRADLGKVFRVVSLILAGLLCLANLYWLSSILYDKDGWQVVSGKLSKEQYLSYPHRTYGVPYYKMAEYINEHLPADAKILLVGEGRSYY
ncbi:MAG: glycosyltransferase family 39 protein, partial [bacterium]